MFFITLGMMNKIVTEYKVYIKKHGLESYFQC